VLGHAVDDLDRQKCIPTGSAEHLPNAPIVVGAEAIPRDVGNGRVGQRAQSDVLDVDTIGGADDKTDVVGSADQYPYDGKADATGTQRPQGI
jgi:hypothetical protein